MYGKESYIARAELILLASYLEGLNVLQRFGGRLPGNFKIGAYILVKWIQ
jgi:hypothetical protein